MGVKTWVLLLLFVLVIIVLVGQIKGTPQVGNCYDEETFECESCPNKGKEECCGRNKKS